VFEFRLVVGVVGNVSGSFEMPAPAASASGNPSDLSLAVCAVRGDVLLLFTGNDPESSRRNSSGEMCGVMRRPGEFRDVVDFEAVVLFDVDAAGSREATRSLPLDDEFELAELVDALREVVPAFADVLALLVEPVAGLAAAPAFCGSREPPKPGNSVSCIDAGSGGIDSAGMLFVELFFELAFVLPFDVRD
jgi:hypothetical protein